ncbi:hypothetical protein [Pontibacter liquoris]|uniref:hypothetical protein n=1 Tax=Pontibacter liquoris TaxID=2905677 RepID=UPI001FA7CCBB|nr:hypothetical protein [Pontibacter liquoris]
MQEFEELKHIWQQSTPVPLSSHLPDTGKASAQTKIKIQNQYRYGAICLLVTAILIASMAIWGNFNFKYWYTYAAMGLICAICLAQAAIKFYTFRKIKQIDQTAPPKQHLSQWEAYYAYRHRLLKWNKPLYFILLNMALGLYFLEVLGNASTQFQLISCTVYTCWMLFAYFFMGKRVIKRENQRIQSIIAELRHLTAQLAE